MILDKEAEFSQEEIDFIRMIVTSMLRAQALEFLKNLEHGHMVAMLKAGGASDDLIEKMSDGLMRETEKEVEQRKRMLVSIFDKLHLYQNCLINQ